jgi:surface-anchored protein
MKITFDKYLTAFEIRYHVPSDHFTQITPIMNNKTNVALLTLVGSSLLLNSAGANMWTAGHGDLGVEYKGAGELEPHWHLGEDNETVVIDGVSQSFGPTGTEFEAGDLTAQTNKTEVRQVGAAWDFTGAAAGDTYYVFPQTDDPAVPYLGFGTEELDPADWSTDITLTLTGFSGPGDFSLYTVDGFGAPTEFISTNGGITGSVSQAADEHTHYNWAFSALGTYSLTFQADGTHAVDGAATGAETFTFSVVPEPSSAGLLLGVTGLVFAFIRRRRA